MIPVLLGYIAGLVTAALVAATLAYFKSPIQRMVESTKQSLENAGPRPRGFIFEPENETELARKKIVAKNSEQGKDTPISELM